MHTRTRPSSEGMVAGCWLLCATVVTLLRMSREEVRERQDEPRKWYTQPYYTSPHFPSSLTWCTLNLVKAKRVFCPVS
ncbi:hypothetical protein MHYP_G00150290 [Metynnis hypsauchen]